MDFIFTGKVWIFGDNISTDLLRPGFSQYGKVPKEEMKYYCMYANRPNWARMVEVGDIIIGGKNFGCGSSRQVAPNLVGLGISCLVAESYSSLFFRNLINVGFPLIECKGITDFFNEREIARIDISTGEIRNLSNNNTIYGLPPQPFLLEILSARGLISLLKKEIEEKNINSKKHKD